jgi:TolA-binding protein
MRLTLFLLLLFPFRFSFAQVASTHAGPAGTASESTTPKPASPAHLTRSQATSAELQKAVDQLTQSNRDLLDLLKKQQAVLEDMQFDRRLQSRQIESLEERLEDTLFQNTQLQNKIARLEAEAAVRPFAASQTPPATPATAPDSVTTSPDQTTPVAATPPPASTFLPAPETQSGPGALSWHRLFTLKGGSNQQSDLFQIQGRTWRVLWHNQDRPGKDYVNTSALFISAFPKDDTIPQKVCSKLGSGGDSGELEGPGSYYLKIEASGGSWELAVEDFR